MVIQIRASVSTFGDWRVDFGVPLGKTIHLNKYALWQMP